MPTLTARDKFRIGDRVQVTLATPTRFRPKITTGTVAGFGRHYWLVRVRVDGLTRSGRLRHPETYHMAYWDVIPAPAPAPPGTPDAV